MEYLTAQCESLYSACRHGTRAHHVHGEGHVLNHSWVAVVEHAT